MGSFCFILLIYIYVKSIADYYLSFSSNNLPKLPSVIDLIFQWLIFLFNFFTLEADLKELTSAKLLSFKITHEWSPVAIIF